MVRTEDETSSESTEEALLQEESSSSALMEPSGAPALNAGPKGTSTQHRWRGALLTLFGCVITVMVMSGPARWGFFGVPIGFFGLLLGSAGLLDLLGAFQKQELLLAHSVPFSKLLPRLVELVIAAGILILLLRLAVAGALVINPSPDASGLSQAAGRQISLAAFTITPCFIWLITSVFRTAQSVGVWVTDEQGKPRGLFKRHGFWLLAITSLLYLPLLGSFSLSDPWETHYGEVAREMLARNDWLSLWWAQDGWFWSKPIFDFWIQGLSFSLLGVAYQPDQMLAGISRGFFPQPEWAARMPVFLVALLGSYILYRGVMKSLGRRAALLGGLVLITTPYWFFLAHQTMTDMPYVGPLAAAGGFCILGFSTDSSVEIRRYQIRFGSRTLSLSAWHLLFLVVLLLALPQVLYLITRNLTLLFEGPNRGFQWHLDTFFAGSGGGNCGMPGNLACRQTTPTYAALWFQPTAMALLWATSLITFILMQRHERRLSRIYFLAAWVATALSVMGKGAPGLVIPLAIALAYVVATRRWALLHRLELPSLLLLVACIALPWYIQMYLRHGAPFTDRLIFHDMFKRAFVHVHDTNVGDDVSFRYYIWQLGYGLFPWTGFAAAGLVWWARKPDQDARFKNDTLLLLALWFVACFGMFSITLTKFHHYIFPAVPAIAMLVGAVLDQLFRGQKTGPGRYASPIKAGSTIPYSLTIGSAAVLLCYASLRLFPGSITGQLVGSAPEGPSTLVAVFVGLTAVACFGLAIFNFSTGVQRLVPGSEQSHNGALFSALAVASAAVILFAGLDMTSHQPGDIQGQARLMHLFTYNYRRLWPDSLDFRGALSGFTLAAVIATLLMASHRLRPHAVALLVAVSLCWAAFGVNSYFYYLAPHWGQRETIAEYYRLRKSPEEPIVAFQMNWKGENFYTGNRIPAFVSSGQRFKDWILEQRKRGVSTLYFTTEPSRVSTLRRELDNPANLEVLTDAKLNNKFILARVIFPPLTTAEAEGSPTTEPANGSPNPN